MKIWTLILDIEDAGIETQVYSGEVAARDAYAAAVAKCWNKTFKGDKDAPDMPADPQDAYDLLYDQTGFADMVILTEHDVIPDDWRSHPDLNSVRGAIDSLMTQIEQMRGMFDDSDDAISNAMDDGDAALALLAEPDKTAAPAQTMDEARAMVAEFRRKNPDLMEAFAKVVIAGTQDKAE